MTLPNGQFEKNMEKIGIRDPLCFLCGEKGGSLTYIDYRIFKMNKNTKEFVEATHSKRLVHSHCQQDYHL